MREVLVTKSGIPKLLLAQQYRKVARDAYQFTKVACLHVWPFPLYFLLSPLQHISDRARDAACFRKTLDPSLGTASGRSLSFAV